MLILKLKNVIDDSDVKVRDQASWLLAKVKVFFDKTLGDCLILYFEINF